MFGFFKKLFIGLLNACATGSFDESLASNFKGHIKCILLNNQICQARPTLVNIKYNVTSLLSIYCLC